MHKITSKVGLILLKLIVLILLVQHGNQASVTPIYQASGFSRSGTWIAFTTLKTESDSIPSYNVVYTSPLAGNPKINAITSVSSMDLLSST